MSKIVIYWACLESEWMRAIQPSSIYNKVIKKESTAQMGLSSCPAFRDYSKNIFGIHSIYEYDFSLQPDGSVISTKYNQEFFNDHVLLRSAQDKCFSFQQKFIFFTEEETLNVSFGVQPFFENNEISKRCMTIPGTIDIGKWFRSLEFAFYLKDDYNDFVINENDIFQYMQVHSDKKIVFKQFVLDDFLDKQILATVDSKINRNGKFRSLSHYYSMLKNKKQIIKAIKNNLID